MKIVIHHGMDSAYDRTARNLLYNFMLRNYKKKHKALKIFLQSVEFPESFNAFAFIAHDHITFHQTIEEAYLDALICDCQRPSFVRIWREGDNQNYICAPETALFGGYEGEMYGSDCKLKQEVKDLAIMTIKYELSVHENGQKSMENDSFTTAP